MTDLTTQPATEPATPERPGRAWWQRLPFLLALGVLPVPFGMYFMAFIAMAVLLSDRTRDTPVRAGGAVALFWWAYSFREGDTTPYFAAPLLVLAAALFAQSALHRRREAAGPWWVPAVAAAGALALALVSFFPDGYRKPELDREAAARRVFEERAARPWRDIKASSYLVERGRARLVHTPLWFVVLYETHETVKRTVDDQPCFTRREVWKVNALDGGVSRVTYDESHVAGDPCLPIRLGTEEDLRPAPPR